MFLVVMLLLLVVSSGEQSLDKRSPLYQNLPDCRNQENFIRITKQTTEKVIVSCCFDLFDVVVGG